VAAAFAFLTVLGRSTAPSPKAVPWFGVVGAFLGAAVGGAWWAAGEVWPVAIAALLAVGVDLALTGMLHLDGLADSGDGLLPPVDRTRRLEILRTPEVGAFGLAVVVICLALRVATLATIAAGGVGNASFPSLVLLPAVLWTVARALAAGAMGLQPYARSSGLAERFVDRSRSILALAAIPVAGAVAAVTLGWLGLASVGGAIVGGVAVLLLSQRRLGGFTGDTLGATIVVAETSGLLVAAAQW